LQKARQCHSDVSVAHQTGNDVAIIAPLTTGNRASRPSAIRTGGYTRGRPEYGNAIGSARERKAQMRRKEIGDADREGEPDRTNRRQRRVGASPE